MKLLFRWPLGIISLTLCDLTLGEIMLSGYISCSNHHISHENCPWSTEQLSDLGENPAPRPRCLSALWKNKHMRLSISCMRWMWAECKYVAVFGWLLEALLDMKQSLCCHLLVICVLVFSWWQLWTDHKLYFTYSRHTHTHKSIEYIKVKL